MLKRYGTAEQFLKTFSPELQTLVAKEWIRSYTGTAPNLETLGIGYGEAFVILWLCTQLENINLFAGAKEKMTVARQKELAALILIEYSYLKVTELLLFFYRLKCGKYGRFYGTVDALFISSALLLFAAERRKDLARINAQAERKQEKQHTSAVQQPTMSYTEYLEWKKRKEELQQQNQQRKEDKL